MDISNKEKSHFQKIKAIRPFSTKKFEMKSCNSVLSVEPPKVNFTFNAVNEVCNARMKINNICGKAVRVYVLPLQSKYFCIHLNNKVVTSHSFYAIHFNFIVGKVSSAIQSCLLPGLPLSLNIRFTADELRHYSDWAKIVCIPGDNNLMIPLQATPASPYNCIPHKINLGSVPLGQIATASFSLPPCVDVDAEFLIYMPQPSSDFCVQPTTGTIMQNGPPIKVAVKFQPTEYITVQFPIQLYIPHSSKSPFTITVLADCKPHLIRERLKASQQEPITKKQTVRRWQIIHAAPHTKTEEEEDDPVKALQKLNTVHGVVKFLLKKEPKKPSPDEMLGPLGRYLHEDYAIYKTKEQDFRRAMHNFRSENQAALLHQRDKPGASLYVDTEMMEQMLVERIAQYEQFQNLLKIETVSHPNTQRRAIRSYNDVPDTSFTDEPNDMWFIRIQALSRFIQAARRVIITNRLHRRLHALQNAREFIQLELETDKEYTEIKETAEEKIVPEEKVKEKKTKNKKA